MALTSIQSKEAFIAQYFLETIKAVFIHKFSYERAGRSLVLHSSFYQIDRVHRSGSDGYNQIIPIIQKKSRSQERGRWLKSKIRLMK